MFYEKSYIFSASKCRGNLVSTLIHGFVDIFIHFYEYIIAVTMIRLRWIPSSKRQLLEAERRVLAYVEKPCEVLDVEIGSLGDVQNCRIHSIKVASSGPTENLPLVLVPGLGCGGVFFVSILNALSERRDVYAIDLIGFGSSSRARLSSDAKTAEELMVEAVERWRRKMDFEQMLLLGHSLGGFISSAYALRYPSRIKHLILEDPWGFAEFDPEERSKLSLYERSFQRMLLHVNALAGLRASGPIGQYLVRRTMNERHPYMRKYFPDAPDTMSDYFFHSNVRRPTGEEFLRKLCENFPFPKYPLIKRMRELSEEVGVTFIHATGSFIPRTPSETLQRLRGEDNTKIRVIEGVGHTMHLEKPDEFSEIVLDVLSQIGENRQ
ncbi:abhydrolase domain-containing protein abhd-5.1 [Galendromus occidentalis]|uniref:Abhydrolase domain-containing protein abhd-5.1 n=1 Tax=Galendromus occidentalis TaxID=34638 RepID=A0AAJ7L813_9ACAR|nr:abhydrolase domain-containing protein abhd-5.1 [Galendromus occidentalis]